MNRQLQTFLEELAKNNVRDEVTLSSFFIPLLLDHTVSMSDCFAMWGLSKKGSELERFVQSRFPFASLQANWERELARRIKFDSPANFESNERIIMWRDEFLLNEVPNIFVGQIREKSQIFLSL